VASSLGWKGVKEDAIAGGAIVRLSCDRRMSEDDAGVSAATAGRRPDFTCNTQPITRNPPETEPVNSS
jgi:hypothetical protein